MKKSTKFILTTAWIIFSRSYDAFCTNQLTPDLSKESNPLVSVLGFGWTPLLLTLIVLTCYCIYVYYKSLFKPITIFPQEQGYGFKEFVVYLYLGRKDSITAVFYKFPKELKRFHQYMGETLTLCLSFSGIVSTLMWLLINYTSYYKAYHSAAFIYFILLLGNGILIYF